MGCIRHTSWQRANLAGCGLGAAAHLAGSCRHTGRGGGADRAAGAGPGAGDAGQRAPCPGGGSRPAPATSMRRTSGIACASAALRTPAASRCASRAWPPSPRSGSTGRKSSAPPRCGVAPGRGAALLRAQNVLHLRFVALGPLLAERRPRPRWKTRLVAEQQLRWWRTTFLGRIPALDPARAAGGTVPAGAARARARSGGPRGAGADAGRW